MKKSNSAIDPYQYLISASFRYLSIRSRSRKEILDYLQKKALVHEITSDVIDQVLTRLEEMEYVNDETFAQAFVSGALRGKPKGPSTIRFELKRKGISEEIIQKTLSGQVEIQDEATQISLAGKALGRKGEQYKKLPVLECKRKVHDYLLRRGFSSAVIHHLVDDYCKKAYNNH